MKYLAFIFLILLSFESNSSVEMIDEHELTEIEYKKLGFLKIVSPSKREPNSPSQIFIIYPKMFKAKFEVSNVLLEVKDDKGILLQTWLKVEDTDHDLLSGSVVNLINPSAISLNISIKYIRLNKGEGSISAGHLIKLGNINSLPETTYSNYQQWRVSP